MFRRSLSIFICLIVASTAFAQDMVDVETLTVDHTRDRLAEVLGVDQVAAHMQTQGTFREATLMLDCYRNGEKVKSISAVSIQSYEPQLFADISLQHADLDSLQLGNAKPGFTRLFCKLTTRGAESSMFGAQSHDIEKAIFDMHIVNGGGRFKDHSSFNGAIPLYYQLRSRGVTGANSPAELLKANPIADIMIVSIVLTNPVR
ncbi:hypothetical protein [Rubinisphaera sp.]|uniref:hypothetical protein n=1 Tax=Rubinisphaera sp. TaxID=2024857 RepID=UPI000C0EE6F1|nr:hypothetical protein [Rubinisphaera sp.]MBV11922.1 hypothetical protein [Rubinisphaera sp.]HCS51523.1 hypothetical protein [Planctomycetaceae bacterium]|tara:strand:+ start:54 stop:662 length:609 start_codon:yes stop_codon:yes gene_type:complete